MPFVLYGEWLLRVSLAVSGYVLHLLLGLPLVFGAPVRLLVRGLSLARGRPSNKGIRVRKLGNGNILTVAGSSSWCTGCESGLLGREVWLPGGLRYLSRRCRSMTSSLSLLKIKFGHEVIRGWLGGRRGLQNLDGYTLYFYSLTSTTDFSLLLFVMSFSWVCWDLKCWMALPSRTNRSPPSCSWDLYLSKK